MAEQSPKMAITGSHQVFDFESSHSRTAQDYADFPSVRQETVDVDAGNGRLSRTGISAPIRHARRRNVACVAIKQKTTATRLDYPQMEHASIVLVGRSLFLGSDSARRFRLPDLCRADRHLHRLPAEFRYFD